MHQQVVADSGKQLSAMPEEVGFHKWLGDLECECAGDRRRGESLRAFGASLAMHCDVLLLGSKPSAMATHM
eukprot:scaffold279218_cov30-Tisochrysis_lutea.AAC.1